MCVRVFARACVRALWSSKTETDRPSHSANTSEVKTIRAALISHHFIIITIITTIIINIYLSWSYFLLSLPPSLFHWEASHWWQSYQCLSEALLVVFFLHLSPVFLAFLFTLTFHGFLILLIFFTTFITYLLLSSSPSSSAAPYPPLLPLTSFLSPLSSSRLLPPSLPGHIFSVLASPLFKFGHIVFSIGTLFPCLHLFLINTHSPLLFLSFPPTPSPFFPHSPLVFQPPSTLSYLSLLGAFALQTFCLLSFTISDIVLFLFLFSPWHFHNFPHCQVLFWALYTAICVFFSGLVKVTFFSSSLMSGFSFLNQRIFSSFSFLTSLFSWKQDQNMKVQELFSQPRQY